MITQNTISSNLGNAKASVEQLARVIDSNLPFIKIHDMPRYKQLLEDFGALGKAIIEKKDRDRYETLLSFRLKSMVTGRVDGKCVIYENGKQGTRVSVVDQKTGASIREDEF